MNPINEGETGRGRRQLLLVVFLFIAPMLGALALSLSGWRPTGTRQTGAFLDPPIDVRAIVATRTDASTVFWNRPEGHWYLIWPIPDACGETCAEMADTLQRVRLRMSRHAPRLEILAVGTPDAMLGPAIAGGAITPVSLSQNLWPAAPAAAAVDRTNPAALPLPLYLIDPNGYWVLSYAAGTDATGLRKDLDRLIN